MTVAELSETLRCLPATSKVAIREVISLDPSSRDYFALSVKRPGNITCEILLKSESR